MFHFRNLAFVAVLVTGVITTAGCDLQAELLPGDGTPEALVADQFSTGATGSWLLEVDDLGSTAIANEQLIISINTPNTVQYATLQDVEFTDFVLEVDARLRSGPSESSYGVLFRMEEPGQFYRFDITGNGLYALEHHTPNGKWTRMSGDWKPSAAINQGLNVVNRLKVIANGPELTLYVNDILLEQVVDRKLLSGAIGLDAGTFSGTGMQVSFDNLVIYDGGSDG